MATQLVVLATQLVVLATQCVAAASQTSELAPLTCALANPSGDIASPSWEPPMSVRRPCNANIEACPAGMGGCKADIGACDAVRRHRFTVVGTSHVRPSSAQRIHGRLRSSSSSSERDCASSHDCFSDSMSCDAKSPGGSALSLSGWPMRHRDHPLLRSCPSRTQTRASSRHDAPSTFTCGASTSRGRASMLHRGSRVSYVGWATWVDGHALVSDMSSVSTSGSQGVTECRRTRRSSPGDGRSAPRNPGTFLEGTT
jgi:hypothetical protein